MNKTFLVLCLIIVLAGGCAEFDRPSLLTPSAISSKPALPFPTSTVTTLTPLPPTAVSSNGMFLDEIDLVDETSGWAWAQVQNLQRRLLHTSDGGLTWVDVTPGEDSPYASYLLNGLTAWATSGEKLALTSDGGNSWSIVNENLPAEFVHSVDWYRFRFEDENHGWLDAGYAAAGAHEFFYETQDGGKTWNPADLKTTPEGLYDSRDFPNELAFWSVIDFIYYDSSRFMIAPGEQEGAFHIFLTNDWGRTWKTIPLPSTSLNNLPNASVVRRIQLPEFFDQQNGVLTVTFLNRETNEVQKVFYGTSDGGLTWSLDGGPFSLQEPKTDIKFFSRQEALYICGVNLCKTNDAGNTWQTVSFGDFAPLDQKHADFHLNFIDPLTGWVLIYTMDDQGVRQKSHLLKTTDGGFTWQEIVPSIRM